MATLSYLRVSTKDQTIENQRQQIVKRGYKIDEEFLDEGLTGMNIERRGFKDMMRFARKGDILVVYSLSRLARSTKQLLEIMETLENKEVKLVSIAESIDTSSAVGRMIVGILAVVNQFEVENMKERQAAGIERAKSEGKYKGRKKIEFPDNWEEVHTKYISRDITGKKAMELLNLKKDTFYKLKKEYKK
jgi:DNA invertase Pin-like site-specific DNA recombinase